MVLPPPPFSKKEIRSPSTKVPKKWKNKEKMEKMSHGK